MWKSIKNSFETPDSYVSLALGLAVVLVVGMITMNYFKTTKLQSEKAAQRNAEITAQAAALPMKYTVVEGDTLWSIAEKLYKSGYNWVDIARENKLTDAFHIEKDQVLLIPDAKPIAVAMGEVSAASTELKQEKRQYKVVLGDNLWSIAVKQYNDGYKWVSIATANNLSNPDVIYVGTDLILP